jgi:hypothetical protein
MVRDVGLDPALVGIVLLADRSGESLVASSHETRRTYFGMGRSIVDGAILLSIRPARRIGRAAPRWPASPGSAG